MKDHQTLLTLIENVDKDDADANAELDARVWCFVNNEVFVSVGYYSTHCNFDIAGVKYKGMDKGVCPIKPYHRSLDAIKAIEDAELQGWRMECKQHGTSEKPLFMFTLDEWTRIVRSVWLPTEYLARLHAVIQAIAWKREQGLCNQPECNEGENDE